MKSNDNIVVKGARVHNLKNINVEIPRNKLVVITGLSGSGKSSLAFDTIYAEGQRRYAESFSAYARQFLGMMDKPDVDQIEGLSPTISIDQRTLTNNPRSTVGTMAEVYDYLRLLFARVGSATCNHCGGKIKRKKVLLPGIDGSRRSKKKYIEVFVCPKCKERFPKLEPRLFSFNSPHGACSNCKGLGTKLDVDIDLIMPNKKLSLAEGAIQPWTKFFSNQPRYWKKLEEVAKKYKFSVKDPVEKLKNKDLNIILYGDPLRGDDSDKSSFFEGVVEILQEKHSRTDSNFLRTEIEKYMKESVCPFCKGNRLRQEALNVKIDKMSISNVSKLTITDARKWIKGLRLVGDEKKLSDQLIKESVKRLDSLIDVGLEYLTLDRSATTLSGGEAQRVRIANQLSSLLTNVIYILDEPSIGLHPRDIDKLINTLKKLRDFKNTVIVVEHEEKIMEEADYIIDVGPGAGVYGGEIVAEGTYSQILKNKNSLTGRYLTGKNKIPKNNEDNKGTGKFIEIVGAKEHNLKNISVKFPLGKFVCVSGVSGSGKSTLIIDILGKALAKRFYRAKDYPGEHKDIKGIENINKVIRIDQSPIGRTPRSNPATYTGVFTYIRNLFTALPESQSFGYDAGFFSFNIDGGRCDLCSGEGYVKVEMQFLADVYIECEACHGKRYNDKALEIFYKGKNIADVLAMSIDDAMNFFKDIPAIYDKLNVLHSVGLGYLPLGQSATTLSGGEAQRIKLATELSKRSTGKTLYILDEPTTGLHFDDIKKLLGVLRSLVDKGNTVLVIEHNLDVMKQSDWIIDLGPGGGDSGGKVICEGHPAKVSKLKRSHTAKYLDEIMEK